MTSVPPITRLLITLCFMGLLMAISIIPGRAQPGDSAFIWLVVKTPPLLQKVMHFCLYCLLTMLWIWTLDVIQSRPYRLAIAVTVAVCFGAALEWYQTMVPGRFGNIFDVALNAGGAILGLCIAILFF